MDDFSLSIRDWLAAGDNAPELRDTTGFLEIRANGIALTRHEDIWSRTVRDAVLVSALPLARWFAHNWWRLNWEPLGASQPPALDWRMAHELGAADHGYVWPRILFASDGEAIQVWMEPLYEPEQSVQYLSRLERPHSVPIGTFQAALDVFMRSVLDRLAAMGHVETELASLCAQVFQERENPEVASRRRLEARLGFDPEECPQELLASVLDLQATTGESAMTELAPAYGPRGDIVRAIAEMTRAPGVPVVPQVEAIGAGDSLLPWQQGVLAARSLRERLRNVRNPVTDQELYGFLGIAQPERLEAVTDKRRPVSVLRPISEKEFVFLPRKPHPHARRFELARILGDWLTTPQAGLDWRVSSNVFTARQKRQRAFAAEFLCPIEALIEFLGGDFSGDAIEAASEHYKVSEWTARSLLANNGYLPPFEPAVPYRLTQETVVVRRPR